MDERIGRKNKIVNDGRKLALDQRLINPDLPDDPDSKVNIVSKKFWKFTNRPKSNVQRK